MTTKMHTKRFQGLTAKVAEAAAIAWSKDLNQHVAVKIDSVATLKKGNKFIATIVYSE